MMKHLIKLRKDFILKKTDKAYLVKLPIKGNTKVSINNHVWLPKSQIMVDDKKEPGMVLFYLPIWLIDRIGLYEFLDNPEYFDYEKSMTARYRCADRFHASRKRSNYKYGVYGDIEGFGDDIDGGIWGEGGDGDCW